jgi:glycosyltransferase involved in cell wall biosynthesis
VTAREAGRPLRVARIITKLAVGGAQQNVLITCHGLPVDRFEQVLAFGPDVDEEGSLRGRAVELGIALHEVPHLVRDVSPIDDTRATVELVRWLRDLRPDLVHTHSSKAGLVGRLAARLARVPVVVHTVHGWSFHDEMSPRLRSATIRAERLAARATDRLVVVTSEDRDKGLAAGIGRPEQYVVIRSAIDLAAFAAPADPVVLAEQRRAARAALGLPAAVPVVGTVGRLADQKDPETWLAAARLVVDAVPDVRFVWIGDGPLRPAVEAAVRRADLHGSVVLAGVRGDVPRLLRALDVFALSSRWEGLPRTVVEAMASGVPVAATAVDGVVEVIDDGRTGRLVPPGDPAALARAVTTLLDDPPRRDAIGSAATERVREFDAAEMLARLERLYQEVAGRRQDRRE